MGLVAGRARFVPGRSRARLRRVAGRARRRRFLRFVCSAGMAGDARGMARIHARRDWRVAARAGAHGCRRRVCGLRVAAFACVMARGCDRPCLLGVTRRAERRRQHRLSRVGRVTVETACRRVVRLVMAALARNGLLSGSERVRRMAPGTRGRGSPRRRGPWMRDLLRVAVRARLRRRAVVLSVATETARVLGRGEHGLVLVAARTRLRLVGGEGMRLVTARALRMSRRDRSEGDSRGRTLLRVTAHAGRGGDERGLVHRVAVEAAACAGVPGLLVRVARRARLHLERGCPMSTMAVAARLISVCTDGGCVKALRIVVTAHAARRANRQIRAEAMTVLTRGNGRECDRIRDVNRCLHAGVTRHTDVGRRRREATVAVTLTARHVVVRDVNGVSRTRTNVLPGHRNVGRWRAITGFAAEQQHHDDDGERPVHRAPTG